MLGGCSPGSNVHCIILFFIICCDSNTGALKKRSAVMWCGRWREGHLLQLESSESRKKTSQVK